MKKKVKDAIECLQCPGCISGSDTSCFEPSDDGVGCGKHSPGTISTFIGKIFLGMPKGFNRLGKGFGYEIDTKIYIYENASDKEYGYDKFNVPVWKHLTEDGHTIVRGMCPRVNTPFIHVYIENCMDEIDCYEATNEDIKAMD